MWYIVSLFTLNICKFHLPGTKVWICKCEIVPQTLTGLRRAGDVYLTSPVKCLFKYIKFFVTGAPGNWDNRQINKKTIVS